jgi:hypothetical protein
VSSMGGLRKHGVGEIIEVETKDDEDETKEGK